MKTKKLPAKVQAAVHREVRPYLKHALPILLCGDDGVSRLPAAFRFPVFGASVALNLTCHGDARRLFCGVRERDRAPLAADVFTTPDRFSAWLDIEGVTRALIEQSALETAVDVSGLDASDLDLASYPRLVKPDRWIDAASFGACVQVSQTRCQPSLFRG